MLHAFGSLNNKSSRKRKKKNKKKKKNKRDVTRQEGMEPNRQANAGQNKNEMKSKR